MDYFKYKNGALFCEEVNISELSNIKTPFYLYSWNTFREHFLRFKDGFKEVEPLICFAVKTCNNPSILKGLSALGAGMDIVSGGELFLCRHAAVPPEMIVYAGVGKTVEEIEFAIESGIGFFNVESEPEFLRIEEIAKRKGAFVKALLRVNPDEYDKRTPDKTTTGKRGGKFGVDYGDALNFFDAHGKSANVNLCGLHIHIGSPIYSPEPYTRAITKIRELIEKIESKGFSIKYLDIGGGFAADYELGDAPSWSDYSAEIVPVLKPLYDRGVKIIIEPGRCISANAGILVCEVQYVKKTSLNRDIIIVDTGMHHLIRPALYGAKHFIWPINTGRTYSVAERKFDLDFEGLIECDIVGPICESSDYLAKERKLPPVYSADRLAVFSAGAYGLVMASRYNSHPLPAEYLVDEDEVILIRKRESYDDLLVL